MKTAADEELAEARRNIDRAITNLAEIVVKQIDGTDEFKHSYRLNLRTAFNRLLEVRDQLGD